MVFGLRLLRCCVDRLRTSRIRNNPTLSLIELSAHVVPPLTRRSEQSRRGIVPCHQGVAATRNLADSIMVGSQALGPTILRVSQPNQRRLSRTNANDRSWPNQEMASCLLPRLLSDRCLVRRRQPCLECRSICDCRHAAATREADGPRPS